MDAQAWMRSAGMTRRVEHAAALDEPTTASSSAPAITAWCSAAISPNAGSTSCWSTAACNTAARWSPRRSPRRASITTCTRSITSTSARRRGSRTSTSATASSYITPRYEFGQPHLDGTALIFGRDLEETLANVARFSKKDAQTFRDWNSKAEEITAKIFLPERFSDPLPQAEREALLAKSDIGRDFLAATKRQPFDVVKELFENEHVQLLFLFKISLFGTWLVDTMSKTSPMGSVIRAFDLQSGYQLCKGGSGNLARALFETFIAAGGRFAPQVELDKIVIEGGKATGIALKDGRTVRAKQFVASTLNVHQTFEDYIGRGAASRGVPEEARQLPVHHLDAVRPASRDARAGALHRREIRSASASHAEMVARRRDDGGVARRA